MTLPTVQNSQRKPYLRNQPGKRAQTADSLTGTVIRRSAVGAVVVVEQTPAHRRAPGYREADGDLVAAPLVLHRHEVEGILGGLEYSVFMASYLNAMTAEMRAEKRVADRASMLEALAWWNDDYGKDRVKRELVRMLGEEKAQAAFEVALTCHQEQAEPSDIARRFGKSAAWVYDKLDLCMRVAGYHQQNCQCAPCVARKADETQRKPGRPARIRVEV